MNDRIQPFKDLTADGAAIRVLYITPNAPSREVQQLEMINEAAALGLEVVANRSTRQLRIGESVAYLRIAHPYLDRELRGVHFHAIHGLEYLDAFEDGERIANELKALVRL